jgi:hypothetical protein
MLLECINQQKKNTTMVVLLASLVVWLLQMSQNPCGSIFAMYWLRAGQNDIIKFCKLAAKFF